MSESVSQPINQSISGESFRGSVDGLEALPLIHSCIPELSHSFSEEVIHSLIQTVSHSFIH